jgi:hypothetical protein
MLIPENGDSVFLRNAGLWYINDVNVSLVKTVKEKAKIKSHMETISFFDSLQKYHYRSCNILENLLSLTFKDPSFSGSSVASTSGVRTAVVLEITLVQSTKVGLLLVTAVHSRVNEISENTENPKDTNPKS